MANLVKYIGWVCGGALLASSCAALAFDPTPARPAIERAGYRVIEADFHVHTTFSDGSLTPIGVVRQADRRGLDAFALTEHNSVLPSYLARIWSELGPRSPVVLRGQEVTSSRFHLIAVGIHETVSPNQPLADVIKDIHRQGGVAIAAHPVKRYWKEYDAVRDQLDGTEVMHPLAYSGGPPGLGWRWEDLRTFYEQTPGVMPIGSSDYHWGSIMGLCRTFVFVHDPTGEDSVMEALRDRRTVVIDRQGRYYGKPELVAALEKEPIPERDADYRYKGTGPGDRIARIVGFLGLLGLVLIGRGSLPAAWMRRSSSPKPSGEPSSSSG